MENSLSSIKYHQWPLPMAIFWLHQKLSIFEPLDFQLSRSLRWDHPMDHPMDLVPEKTYGQFTCEVHPWSDDITTCKLWDIFKKWFLYMINLINSMFKSQTRILIMDRFTWPISGRLRSPEISGRSKGTRMGYKNVLGSHQWEFKQAYVNKSKTSDQIQFKSSQTSRARRLCGRFWYGVSSFSAVNFGDFSG